MVGVRAWAFMVLVAAVACRAQPRANVPSRDVGNVTALDFRGWPAMALRNAHTELVVVPAIGRVMSLGLAGDVAASDPIWRHDQLGPKLAGDENGWINYGGDKAWPAPQSDWQQVVGKAWPPPATFDATAHMATMKGSSIEMVSPIDPAYGLRVRRTVTLSDALVLIDTAYEKVEGPPVRVAVWTITQLQSPDRMFALLSERDRPAFSGGYRSLLPARPKDLRIDGRLLGIARDTNEKTMIAIDADALVWVGSGRTLLIQNAGTYVATGPNWQPTEESAPRPGGARAQIYTSPDGAEPYVELELLGPLVDLTPGQRAMMSVRYRLVRREEMDPITEARRLFAAALR
jgi:hypothetical protein